MDIKTAVETVLHKYADFSGRARRSEFWYWVLAVFLLDIVLAIIAAIIGTSILSYLVGLALLVPNLAVGARRLHDTGRSGWFLLLGLIPIVGIILLIVWWAQDSAPAANEYGPNPKGGDALAPGYGAPPTV